MGIEPLVKRYFVVLVCVLIGSAAYFQAAGMSQLLAATIGSAQAAPRDAAAVRKATAPSRLGRSAQPILSRNAFDSITGPLDGRSIPLEDGPKPIRNADDPYEDPPCDSASVTLIMASEDPEWSFAAIQGADGQNQLRRIGQDVGGLKVHHIGWFHGGPDSQPRVWLEQAGSRCMLDLSSEKTAASPPKAAAARTTSNAARRRGGGTAVPDDIASKIRKISDTQYELDRSVVDQILGQQALLMKSVRMRPSSEGGMKIAGVRADSVLGTLGLKNGDELVSINGFDMSDPEKALEAYTRLRTADSLNLTLKRGGADLSMDYGIK